MTQLHQKYTTEAPELGDTLHQSASDASAISWAELLKAIRRWIDGWRLVDTSRSESQPGVLLNAALACTIIFLYHAALSPFGMDVTDQGYHLTNQYCTRVAPGTSPWMFFFTDYVGGQWLRLSPWGPSLLWWRLGGALLMGLCAGMTLLILCRFVSARRAMISTIAGWLTVPLFTGAIFDYYTFPMLLSFCWLYVFLRAWEAHGERARCCWVTVLGVLNVMLAFARLPMILACGIPFGILVLYCVRTKARPVRNSLRYLLYWSTGAVLTGVLLFLWERGIGVDFQQALRAESTASNIREYLESLLWGCRRGTKLVAGLVLLVVFSQHRILRYAAASGCVLLAGWLFRNIFAGSAFDAYLGTLKNVHLLIGSGCVVVVGVLLVSSRFQLPMKHWCLLWGVLMFFVVTPVGSTDGNLKMLYILPIVMGIVFAWGLLNVHPWRTCWVLYVAAGVSVVAGLVGQITPTYRDARRWHCTTAFTIPPLRGIYSTPERVRVVEEFYRALAKHVPPGEELLAVRGIPMVDYLAQTRPWLEKSWPMLWPSDVFRARFEALRAKKGLPKWIAVALKNTRDFDWPCIPDEPVSQGYRENDRFVQTIMRSEGYICLFSNEMFALYGLP